ncbi:MAG: bifunctional hydroxymethylpyrimidine kinase/phosphomethylpyrimidine kinase [Pseudomonadota bacterium]
MVAKALTIAGSDSGGGAGIQADLKAFSAMGVFGASVITAITAQNTTAVTAVHPIPDDVVAKQIRAVLDDIDIGAIKIGMLGTPSLMQAVADAIAGFSGPVVLDPVMVAKSGDALLHDSAIDALRRVLLPRADLLTPNLPEAGKLLDHPTDTPADAEAQAEALLALGAKAVLMKGGHADGETCTDLLVQQGRSDTFSAPRIATQNTHGTGCSYSSAIAALLAKGTTLQDAVGQAHDWLHGAITRADELNVGHGHGPVHHFYQMWG